MSRLEHVLRTCPESGCPVLVRRGRCPEHRRERGRAWRRLVAEVVRRDRGVCWLAPAGRDERRPPRALRDGGDDSLENLRAAHVDCNRRRG